MDNKKSFRQGLFYGFAIGIIVTCAIFSITMYFAIERYKKKANDNNTVTITPEIAQNSDALSQKISGLKAIVDKYFLDDYDSEKLYEYAYKGFMAGLSDPYSVYYTAEEYKTLIEQNDGVYYGIGVQLTQSRETGIITATKVFKNSPGEKAGIKVGDVLYKVSDEEVTGVDLTTVVSKIRGDENTKVHLSLVRPNVEDVVEVDVIRGKVEVTTVEYEMLDNNIGYILLSDFEEVTANQFKEALNDLNSQNMKGLIVDVRNNPGGLLSSVNDVLRNLLPKGIIVYTVDKNGSKITYECDGTHEFKLPMVVLTNKNSASAAEIFAGALKDYKKATLVGNTTFGKGIVQNIFGLNDGSAVKVTVSKYYTPNGVNIHKTGIEPDVTVDLDEELLYVSDIPKDKDNQLQKGIEELLKMIN